MMINTFGKKAALTAVALLCSTSAAAQTTYFDFTSDLNSATSGTLGNSKIFWNNDKTISVIATAWTLTTKNGTPTAAYLGSYTNGLGVTTAGEGSGGGNSHTIDNVGSYDFVTLGFSRPVQLLYGALTPYDVDTSTGGADNDVSVSFSFDKTMSTKWSASAITTNMPLWNDLKLHTTELAGNMRSSQDYATNLNPGMNTGNVWTVGADRLLDLYPARNDGFKLAGLSVQIPTPEPATWAMMIMGFGVIGGTLRRREGRGRLATA